MGNKIAVLASGNGSGFEAIYNGIKDKELDASVEVVISNNNFLFLQFIWYDCSGPLTNRNLQI